MFIKSFIKKSISIDLKNGDGETPLMISLMYLNYTSSIETVKFLLENGANINLQDRSGNTSLILALRDIYLYFYEIYDEHCFLKHFIVSSFEIMELLLENGADPNIQNKSGYTVLMIASIKKKPLKIIKLLIENGANPDLKNKDGKTAFDLASTDECKNLIKSYMN